MVRRAKQSARRRTSVSASASSRAGSVEQSFRIFHTFNIANDGETYSFTSGTNVTILPHGFAPGQPIEPWQYWVGRITEIRAPVGETEGESDAVKVKVQWYYDAQDASRTIKSFKANAVGQYERILSEMYDTIDPYAFNATIPVIIFLEEDHLAPYISWDTFYCRYAFERKMRAIQPKPGTAACNCQEPYNPNDASPASLMHFCPTPDCRRAYHQRCLLKTSTPADPSSALLLATSPFDNKGLDSDLGGPVKKRRRSGRLSSQSSSLVTDPEEQQSALAEALSSLPEELVTIAQQPMVRGAAFPGGGVSGNIGFVTRARELVYDFLENGTIPEDWEDAVFSPRKPGVQTGTLSNAIVVIAGEKADLPIFHCPNCHSAI